MDANESERGCAALMILSVLVVTASLLSPASLAEEPGVPMFDGFEGKLKLDWMPVREDKAHVSLTENPGKLTITTQQGTIGFDQARPGIIPAKNLYVVRNPIDAGGDFVITTCVESFRPTKRYQQAGLLIYDDDDNYLKYDMEFSGSGTRFKYMRETDGRRVLETDDVVPLVPRIWLRITKRGHVYERAFSTDGTKYNSSGEKAWGSGSPKWVGLVAKNGMSTDEGVPAKFDFFELRELTDAEKQDPRYVDRKQMQGAWKVVSVIAAGTTLEQGAFSDFVFDGGHVSFSEGTQTHRADYSLWSESTPKVIEMSAIAGDPNQPAKGIYAIEGDKLVICLSADPRGKPPSEFASTKRNSQVLIELQRKR